MPNTLALFLDSIAGRLIAGVLNLASYHPLALCLVLAVVAGAASALLLEAVANRS